MNAPFIQSIPRLSVNGLSLALFPAITWGGERGNPPRRKTLAMWRQRSPKESTVSCELPSDDEAAAWHSPALTGSSWCHGRCVQATSHWGPQHTALLARRNVRENHLAIREPRSKDPRPSENHAYGTTHSARENRLRPSLRVRHRTLRATGFAPAERFGATLGDISHRHAFVFPLKLLAPV